MKRFVGVATLLTIIVAIMVSLPQASIEGQERDKAPAQPLQGKYLSIVTRSSPTTSVEIEKVQFKKVEGRTFLIGTGIDVPGNWQKGLEVWVAFDEVATITAFPTLEEFKRGILKDATR